MIYQSTSISEVIGRIIRATRLQDTSFIVDMDEWIPEAMGLMKTKLALQSRWQDVDIEFHVGKLPCGLDHIKAVEHNGCRLPHVVSTRSIEMARQRVITEKEYEQQRSITISEEGNTVYQSITVSADQALSLPISRGEYYDIEMGYIKTSICDGTIRIHYRGIALDKDGLPLIPDNEDYKTALTYYVRAQMIGAGYEDKVFSFDKCMQYFEKHAARAIGQIRYPSVDNMEVQAMNLNKLIKIPGEYFNSFFGNTDTSEPGTMTVATSPMGINKSTIIIDRS